MGRGTKLVALGSQRPLPGLIGPQQPTKKLRTSDIKEKDWFWNFPAPKDSMDPILTPLLVPPPRPPESQAESPDWNPDPPSEQDNKAASASPVPVAVVPQFSPTKNPILARIGEYFTDGEKWRLKTERRTRSAHIADIRTVRQQQEQKRQLMEEQKRARRSRSRREPPQDTSDIHDINLLQDIFREYVDGVFQRASDLIFNANDGRNMAIRHHTDNIYVPIGMFLRGGVGNRLRSSGRLDKAQKYSKYVYEYWRKAELEHLFEDNAFSREFDNEQSDVIVSEEKPLKASWSATTELLSFSFYLIRTGPDGTLLAPT